jgi:hypothetical protein
MAHYFINNHGANDGAHEVHLVGCKQMPVDKAYLGNFEHVGEALVEARKDFWQSRGCLSCAREYRTEYRAVLVPIHKAPLV